MLEDWFTVAKYICYGKGNNFMNYSEDYNDQDVEDGLCQDCGQSYAVEGSELCEDCNRALKY